MTVINKDLVFTGGGGRFNAYYSFFLHKEKSKLVHNNNNKIMGTGTGAIAAALFASGAGPIDFVHMAINLNQSLKTDFEMIHKESLRFHPNMNTDAGFDIRNYWDIPVLNKILIEVSKHIFLFLVPMLRTEDTANPFRYMKTHMDVYKALHLLLFDYGIIPLFGFREFIDRRLKELALNQAPNHHFTKAGLTFKEHRELFQTDLRIVANLANEDKAFEFCSENTPNVAVADALRAGMATPFVFSPTMGLLNRGAKSDPFLKADHFLNAYLELFRGFMNATDNSLDGRTRTMGERMADAIRHYIQELRSGSPYRDGKYQVKQNLTEEEVKKLDGIVNEGNMVANFPEGELQNPTLVLDINNVSEEGRVVTDFPSFFRNIFNALRHNTTLIYAQGSGATLAKLNIEPFTEFNYNYSYEVLDQNYESNKSILNQAFQTTSSKTKNQ